MIVDLERAKACLPEEVPEDTLKEKLRALEELIRAYTNNRFQERRVRAVVPSSDETLMWDMPYLKAGDTVEIGESLNDGLYIVREVKDGLVYLDRELYPLPHNLATKIVYPADVQEGVLNLLKWEYTMRDKVGIKSETLSRHSVTYYDQDAGNQVMGYPASLMGFLSPYIKARF